MRSLNVKKKLVTLGLVVVMAMGQCMSAFANYSDISMWVWTGTIAAEHLRPGYDSQSKVYKIESKIFSNCCGSKTKIKITRKGSLVQSFSADSSRVVYVQLWEDDVNNSDDLVSIYKGSFKGRYLSNFVLDKREISGLIDANGDSQAEFYTMSRISRCSIPEYTLFSNSFFDYEIGMQ